MYNNNYRRSVAACQLAAPEIEGVPLLAPEHRTRIAGQLANLRGHKHAVQLANELIRAEVFGSAEVDGETIAKAWRLNRLDQIGGAR